MSELAEKLSEFVAAPEGGLKCKDVEKNRQNIPALSDQEAVEIARLLVDLESAFGTPLDFEWGIEDGMTVCYIATQLCYSHSLFTFPFI